VIIVEYAMLGNAVLDAMLDAILDAMAYPNAMLGKVLCFEMIY